MTILLRVQIILIVFSFSTKTKAQVKSIQLSKGAFAPHYSLPKGETIYVDGKPTVTRQELNVTIIDQVGDSINVIVVNKKDSAIAAFAEGNNTNTTLYSGKGANLHMKYTDWDTSPLVIPIKIRPFIDDTPLEFVGEFTLGSYIGYQTGSKSISDIDAYHYSQTFSGFAAPTMVRINPETADTDKSNLVLGFSLGLGYIVNLNDFQIGLVGGVDYISGDASKTWIYQGRPWFSFTVGFDFNDE